MCELSAAIGSYKFSVIELSMWSVYGKKIGGVWFSLLINKLTDSYERKAIYENLDISPICS